MKKSYTPDEYDKLIQEAIDKLASDDIQEGTEALVEIAYTFAAAGMDKESFNNLRIYIIESAARKHGSSDFIYTKVNLAEKELNERRNGNNPRIIIQ